MLDGVDVEGVEPGCELLLAELGHLVEVCKVDDHDFAARSERVTCMFEGFLRFLDHGEAVREHDAIGFGGEL